MVCVWILGDDHHHHDHEHADHNLKAAYLHVLVDAMTSVLAIITLVAGSFLGWVWLDVLMGIVGGALAHVTFEINICEDEECLPETRPLAANTSQ